VWINAALGNYCCGKVIEIVKDLQGRARRVREEKEREKEREVKAKGVR